MVEDGIELICPPKRIDSSEVAGRQGVGVGMGGRGGGVWESARSLAGFDNTHSSISVPTGSITLS